ncbi:siderophore ABC transporter substrate-binding protein [Abyssicoccus albus]|uniref:siderophore ABC transporter substrate-binding protein n=1 Tax=Abyssicoccus albus TaxID=1817405 RepID=UPI00097E1BA9|nr:ABC transporter substrate-binding protein [Abyssicoccus albus]AQL56721.1 iron ABC transporter substrate-binding protein [Abyssicoccus albus]
MKKFLIFMLSITVVVLLAACNNESEDKDTKGDDTSSKSETVQLENTFTVTGEAEDGSEDNEVKEKVEIAQNPEKVVVFDYGILDLLNKIDATDKIIGVPKGNGTSTLPEFLSDFNKEEIENIGSVKEPDFEKIAELQPNVILISARQATQKNLDEFKKAAPDAKVVFVGPDMNNYVGSMKTNAENIGKIFDKEAEVKEHIDKLDQAIEDVKTVAQDSDKKAMFVLANEGELSTYGPGGRFGFIFSELGLTPVDKDVKDSSHGQVISFEYINAKNPDIIYAMDRGVAIGGKSSAKKALGNKVIKDVNAIKNDNVIEVDPYIWYVAGGSVTTTLEQINEVKEGLK